jgi:hypothetical protein
MPLWTAPCLFLIFLAATALILLRTAGVKRAFALLTAALALAALTYAAASVCLALSVP